MSNENALMRPPPEVYFRQLDAMMEKARSAANAECAAKKDFSNFDAVFHAKVSAVQRGEI